MLAPSLGLMSPIRQPPQCERLNSRPGDDDRTSQQGRRAVVAASMGTMNVGGPERQHCCTKRQARWVSLTWSQADSPIDSVHEIRVTSVPVSVPKLESTHRTSVHCHRITPNSDRLVRTLLGVEVRHRDGSLQRVRAVPPSHVTADASWRWCLMKGPNDRLVLRGATER